MLIKGLRKKLDRRLSSLRLARTKAKEERLALRELKKRIRALEEAQTIAQDVAAKIQTRAHSRIAEIVTQCLGIFDDDPVGFRIEFKRKRGKTEAHLSFLRDGHEVDPLSASGIGVVEVAALALRLACLVLSRPPLRRLLVLDEPFSRVSPGYVPKVRQILEKLAEELELQIILVTHHPKLEAGKVISLGT